jgi:hypothetical protein
MQHPISPVRIGMIDETGCGYSAKRSDGTDVSMLGVIGVSPFIDPTHRRIIPAQFDVIVLKLPLFRYPPS